MKNGAGDDDFLYKTEKAPQGGARYVKGVD